MHLLTAVANRDEADARSTAVDRQRRWSDREEAATMNGFLCQVSKNGNLAVVTVHGDVDLSVTEILWHHLEALLTPSTRVIVDCRAITFIDSVGLQSLLRAALMASQFGVDFALATPSGPVTRVLALSGAAEAFTILDVVPVGPGVPGPGDTALRH
jgi:anti-sigma B factor antagonist